MRKLNIYLSTVAAMACLYTTIAQAATQYGVCAAYVRYKKDIPVDARGRQITDNAWKIFIKWEFKEPISQELLGELSTDVNGYPNTHLDIRSKNNFALHNDKNHEIQKIVGLIPAQDGKNSRKWAIEGQHILGIDGEWRTKWKVSYGDEADFTVLEDSVNCSTRQSPLGVLPQPKLPHGEIIDPVPFDIKYITPPPQVDVREPQKEGGICSHCAVS